MKNKRGKQFFYQEALENMEQSAVESWFHRPRYKSCYLLFFSLFVRAGSNSMKGKKTNWAYGADQ